MSQKLITRKYKLADNGNLYSAGLLILCLCTLSLNASWGEERRLDDVSGAKLQNKSGEITKNTDVISII